MILYYKSKVNSITQFTEIIFNIKFNIFNKNLKFISIKYSVLFYITNAINVLSYSE